MSYQVLARKWRPKSFREMVGQEHVLKALINALDHDRLHHAYLFTGTRGVGKTTIARILAKCLNCEPGVSSEPCGECASCMEIAEGRSVDLLEVDAASRTKVEDTRELLDNVQYAPTRCRYKVYLIDEVHMLSGHSFNALLKTLEEPPPHVKFLLATTDPQKLPATILSRCLQFNLKNMPPEQVVGHLNNVLSQEMISYEEPALWLLGRAANGSMRDALSLTDQAIAYGSGKLLEADVRAMLGTVDRSFVYQLLEAIADNAAAELLNVVAAMAEHAPDFESALDELISLLHRISVAQVVPDAIDNSWGDAERVAALAGRFSAEDVQLFYQMGLHGKRDLGLAGDARSGFEMCLLRMLAFRPQAVIDPALGPEDLQPVSVPGVQEGAAPVKKSPSEAPPHSESAGTANRAAPISPAVVGADEVSALKRLVGGEPPPSGSAEAGTVVSPVEAVPELEPPAAPVVEPEAEPALEASRVREPEPVAASAPAVAAVVQEDVTAPATPADVTAESWPQLLAALPLTGMVHNVASHCAFSHREGECLHFIRDEAQTALFNDGHVGRIAQALSAHLGCQVTVAINTGDLPAETPAMLRQRQIAQRQAQAVADIEADGCLRGLIERFDGALDRNSISPLDS